MIALVIKRPSPNNILKTFCKYLDWFSCLWLQLWSTWGSIWIWVPQFFTRIYIFWSLSGLGRSSALHAFDWRHGICQLVISSTSHFINLYFHQLVISSMCHNINVPWNLSTGHLINLSFHQCVILSMCHEICQLVISSTGHFINLSFHQLVISSTCHFINVSFHQV